MNRTRGPNRYSKPRGGTVRRTAFTLVELLVTMTILALLATMVLAGLSSAREAARAAKTRSTIAKLNRVIMEKYDSYRTRRVPLDVETYVKNNSSKYDTSATGLPQSIARARLNALRDLMRREMPDRWSEVTSTSNAIISTSPRLAAHQYFYDAYNRAVSATNASTVARNADSKLLYLIVMMNPEAAAMFGADEIGEPDRDSLKVFLDGWGRPIKYLRWPAGFLPYDATFTPYVPMSYGALWGADTDLQTNARVAGTTGSAGNELVSPDPFNPRRISASYGGSANPAGINYALFPLIYSAGPDGEYDINIGKDSSGNMSDYAFNTSTGNRDPYGTDATNTYLVGQPLNNQSPTLPPRHLDNIHNQRLEIR